METQMNQRWRRVLEGLDHAFQPIALLADGSSYGFEALLRGWDTVGFDSIASVFDRAHEEGMLKCLDLELQRRAFAKFARAGFRKSKIFYNVDNRLLQLPNYGTDAILDMAREAGLPASRIVFELSELHEPGHETHFERAIASFRGMGFRIALDDFGSGYAGLKLLHRAEPDIVKIDRYFVGGSALDPRKVAFLEKIVGMAHLMGVTVVAEGVETTEELRICADSGCDMIQGFYIARPSLDLRSLEHSYDAKTREAKGKRGSKSSGGPVVRENVLNTQPIGLRVNLVDVLDRFRKNPELSLLPVVNDEGEPVGAYRERDFRNYVYSPFGISLLEHVITELGALTLLRNAPMAPLGSDLARIVELYSSSPELGGIILVKKGKYAGILPAERLLDLVAERDLAEARDQNPLTRLPGNLKIAEVCAEALADPGAGAAFAYLDFDNFKPFNDRYGFRNGDRIIMLFADILKSAIRRPPGFVGHLGGDDFFASVPAPGGVEDIGVLRDIAERFAREATSFYSPEDRERGWILGKDRSGTEQRMPLLTVSVAVVLLKPGARLDAEGLSEALAELKREAKTSLRRFALRIIEGEDADSGRADPGGDATDSPSEGQIRRGGFRALPIFTPGLIAAF
ncbi:MAG: GGDEF domain-containing protein [Rectinemataceae bacterium]